MPELSDKDVLLSAASALATLSSERKIYALSLLAHNLTIGARGVYSDRDTAHDTVEKFYTINEMLHQLSSQLMHLSSGDDTPVPDTTLIQILYERAREGGCEVELISAIKFSLPNWK